LKYARKGLLTLDDAFKIRMTGMVCRSAWILAVPGFGNSHNKGCSHILHIDRTAIKYAIQHIGPYVEMQIDDTGITSITEGSSKRVHGLRLLLWCGKLWNKPTAGCLVLALIDPFLICEQAIRFFDPDIINIYVLHIRLVKELRTQTSYTPSISIGCDERFIRRLWCSADIECCIRPPKVQQIFRSFVWFGRGLLRICQQRMMGNRRRELT